MSAVLFTIDDQAVHAACTETLTLQRPAKLGEWTITRCTNAWYARRKKFNGSTEVVKAVDRPRFVENLLRAENKLRGPQQRGGFNDR